MSISIADPCPMVNFELMQRFVGRKVRLVASVEDVQGGAAQVKAADGGTVHIQLREPASFDTKFVMFEGTVDSPNSLREASHTNFGNTFGARARLGFGRAIQRFGPERQGASRMAASPSRRDGRGCELQTPCMP